MAVTIRLRRGTKAQLDSLMGGATPMVSGEVGFTTDTNEVFVSDGSSAHLVGRVVVDIFANRPSAGVSGRLFHASDTDSTYVDDGSAWVNVSVGVSDLDGIPDGTVYGKVRQTELTDGRVNRLATTVSGVYITGQEIRTHVNDVTLHRVINDVSTTATDLWSAQKIGNAIDNAIAGLDFQKDVLNKQVDATLDPGGTPTTGDRYILTNVSTLHANFGTITGVGNNDIVEYTGSVFEVAYDVSTEGEGVLVWNMNANYYERWDGTSWSEFGGLSGVTAGAGLTKTGNTLDVGAGDGIAVNVDDVAVNVSALVGVGIQDDGSNNFRLGSQGNGIGGGGGSLLNVSPDSTTGVTVAPVSVGSNGVGVHIDNDSIGHTTGTIEVVKVDGGSFV